MDFKDFTIGQDFWTENAAYRCTDKGSRVVVAMRLDHPSDPSWYNGPPYAVAEHVFDENSIVTCYPTRAEAVEDFGEADILAWEASRDQVVRTPSPPPMVQLKLTCSACPELYEAFIGDRQVGYLRLRHGEFRVDVPDCGGPTIYLAYPMGDGVFEDGERHRYLSFAVDAILKYERGEWKPAAELPTPEVNFEVEGEKPGFLLQTEFD